MSLIATVDIFHKVVFVTFYSSTFLALTACQIEAE